MILKSYVPLLLGAFFALIPLPTFAADIDASADSLSFSQSDFFAGDQIRVYGALTNKGDKDINGIVEFFQGVNQIGEPRPFSIKAFGPTAYVWVDWTATEGTYNVSMKIMSTEPIDQNLSNNTAVSGLMTITKRPPPPPTPAPTPAPSVVQPLMLPKEPSKTLSQAKPKIAEKEVVVKKEILPPQEKTTPHQNTPALAKATADTQKELAPLADELKDIIKESLEKEVAQTGEKQSLETQNMNRETQLEVAREEIPQKNGGKKILYLFGILAALSLAGGSYFLYLSRKE
ncbi:hypothetical protein HY620_01635 [Candidatus Uhrbacteria bacterium]|nr:hypothetical protein [Candidatus Uhrbacteria bacterium]